MIHKKNLRGILDLTKINGANKTIEDFAEQRLKKLKKRKEVKNFTNPTIRQMAVVNVSDL